MLEDGDFEATLAAAAGQDAQLRAELLAGFLESMNKQIDLLQRARCDGNWEVAAMRLRGLGTSFHSPQLTSLSEQALDGAPGDPSVLRKLRAFAESLTHSE
ncbi:Hpt domain-containing protein [Alteraurantiacibacter aquimixticola]|uniref:Hpt domain-containing protein n=1 Tax=Alteraurantiacibacter aquimixticola TaxID=2489173 RepID=A0A4V4U909_9SPHN|nr:Hpt domain-containing protein [Alteraurantiacibacter aquimixticola]TIX50003.1 Hpt domain-containing protein [Alteraurantiacibacter aquimixticola]